MADVARVVDEIRGFLLSYDQGMKPGLIEIARNYAELCAEANKRLAKCQRLLQQGLRAEAIHLSKQPPDLLDSVQALEFAERGLWLDIVRQFDLAVPPELDASSVEFLHSAYVEENPLRHLLKTHRRLALQRAPLSRRLQVLRELAVSDPQSPVWPADIQIFESARIDQIQNEATEAKRHKDLATLALLKEELSSKDWTTPPPKPLARDVAQTLAHLRTIQKRQDQVSLINELHDAFAALDVDKGREIRTRWLLMDGDGDPRSNPLYSQVEPVFLWLAERDREDEEENRYHQALAELTQSVEMATTRNELESSHELLVQAGRGVPEDLSQKYRERIDHYTRQSAQRRRLIAMAVMLLLAASLVVAALVFKNRSVEAEAQNYAKQFGEWIEVNQIDKAKVLRDQLSVDDPQMLEHPDVVAEVAKLDEKLKVESERVHKFETLLKSADDAPIEANEPGQLLEALELAKSPEEKSRVNEIRSRRLAKYQERLKKTNEEKLQELKIVNKSIQNLKVKFEQDGEAAMKVITELHHQHSILMDIKNHANGLDDRTLQEFAGTLKLANELQNQVQTRKNERDFEEKASRAFLELGQVTKQYPNVLKEASEALSGTKKSEDFRQVLAEQPIWAGALDWARLVSELRGAFANEDPVEAERQVGRCNQLLNDYPRMPDRRTVEQVRDHFQAIAQRTLGDHNLKNKIIDFLNNPIIANVYVTTVSDYKGPRHYYSKEPFQKSTGNLMILAGPGMRKLDRNFRAESVVSPKDSERPQLSPQSNLATKLLQDLETQKNLHGWDTMLPDFMGKVAEASFENVSMDPILKYMMINGLNNIAVQGSRPLAVGLAKLSGALKETGEEINDKLPWLNPEDRESDTSRDRAKKFLIKFKELYRDIKATTNLARSTLMLECSQTPQPYGWLVKGKDFNWECRTLSGPTLPVLGELMIARGTTEGEWHTIGLSKGASPRLSENSSNPHLIQGGLVFVRPKAATDVR